ncbi:MAG: 50S ribosomal protein L18 [Thermoguttaceae bacterium]
MKKFKKLNLQKQRRAYRVANAVKRYSNRPRLCVFRSNKHIYVQVIDDNSGRTLASAGTNDKDIRDQIAFGGNCDAAAKIGELVAKKALAAGVTQVAFDRHGFRYHGRIQVLADAARKAGLDIGSASDNYTEEELAARAAKKGKSNSKSADKKASKVQKGAPAKQGQKKK